MAYKFNDDNFKQELASGKPIVVDFWAEWCGPCKRLAPIVDELAQEYEGRVLVGKYDVDDAGDLPVDFGVRNIPTLLFFKGGQLVDRAVGAMPREVLVEKINALL